MKTIYRYSFITVAIMFCTNIALMSQILFQDGFESADLSLWNKYGNPTLVNGTAEVVTLPVKSGSYAFKSDIVTNTGWVFRKAYTSKQFSTDANDVLFFKTYFNIVTESNFSSQSNFIVLAQVGVGERQNIGLRTYSDGHHLYYSTKGLKGNTIISPNTWYCIEIEYNKLAGEVRIWLNSELEFESTGNTLNTVDELRIGWNTNVPNVSGPLLFDDITVSTERLEDGDIEAPSIPGGLSSINLTQTGFTLNWTASTDNVGVTGYEVFKDGSSIGTTTSTTMDVTDLTSSTTYAMTVRARDEAGNWSEQSSPLEVTTETIGTDVNDAISLSNSDLIKNSPNPFTDQTKISCKIPVAGLVCLKVYDVMGRELATLINERKSVGEFNVNWGASESGMYFLRMTILPEGLVNPLIYNRKVVSVK